jgi:hypothetical protein
MNTLTESSYYFDYTNTMFQSYLSPIFVLPREKQAESLFEKVREDFRYDPYHLDLRPHALVASNIIQKKTAWCVEKAIVLTSGFRALGYPAKIGFGIVINHIGVEKLNKYLRRPEIVFHGYVAVLYNNKWQKLTPAFDSIVCRASRVHPMNWDGDCDVMFQEFDKKGGKFMEYIHYYGEFKDVPVELMNAEMKKYYPHLFEEQYVSKEFSFYHL